MKVSRTILIVLFVGQSLLCYSTAQAFVELSDCLVTQDIGIFKFDNKKARMGKASGVVGLTGHFQDHLDQICTGDYSNIDEIRGLPDEEAYDKIFTIDVQVTQHAGADSDKWLLHEIERSFRRGDYEENMTPFRFKNINGKNYFYSGLGGGTYRWLSNNIVVNIEYTDLYKKKTEPVEVIHAYLTKFPSTIPSMTVDRAHNETWIRDEMERRLWLCDKWFMQLQLGKVDEKTAFKKAVDHIGIFLTYRDKYYGVDGEADARALVNYRNQNNGTMIKMKLEEYKKWWEENKENPINL